MENVKKFIKQNLQLILLVLCGALVLSGILVMVFGGGNSEGFLKVMFVIFGIVLIALGCALVFYAVVAYADVSSNFFLYDTQNKTDISEDQLTFEIVNKKMTYVMTKLVSSASKVWTENVLGENEEFFKGKEIFKPLVAYKMLYDLFDRGNANVWNLYLNADASIIDSIADALELNEDGELGKAFKFLHENSDGNYERTEKFLVDNKKYIQGKMLKYVKNNLGKFGQL